MLSHQLHRFQQIFKLLLIDEVVEVEAHPTWTQDHRSLLNFSLNGTAIIHVHAQQAVAIGTRARAAAAHLYTKQIIEQRNHETVMQIHVAVLEPQ